MSPRSAVAILLVLLCAGMFAQEYRGTIVGTVTDPSGSAIPNAGIKATNLSTNRSSETKSSSDGVFTLPFLEPGVYRVEASAPGFQSLKRESVTVAVGQRLNLPMQLAVGQATTEITVTGQVETLETADAARGLLFDPVKTQEYPLNGRQSYMLMSLTPGVIFTQETFGSTGFSGTRGWDVNSSYKFNGARAGNGNNVFMMNGTPISNEGSTWEFAPSVDAIQEFSAMTTVYDAQYGHEAGGVVNTVIRGGSNAWHGDIYDYFRNAVLDANNFGNNYAGARKGNHQQNQFGGVFGGPIRKDKDFVFLSYEGWQEIIPFPGAGVTAVPLDLRNGQGFSKYGMTIADPLTTHPCTPGSGAASTEPCSGNFGSNYWRVPFPGNVIPASRISPIATKILSYLPAPNAPGQGAAGITNNYVNAGNTGRYWYNQPIARWDHSFGTKNKFYALFSEFHGYEFRSSSTFPKPVATGNLDNNRTFTGLNLDDTHVLSPTMVLDIKASYFRFVQLTPGYSDQARAITPQSLGMTNMIHAPSVSDSVIPNINIGGYTGSLFGSGSISWSPYNRWIFSPNLTMTKGAHSLHFGFEYNYETRGNVSGGNAYGTFTFGAGLTQLATDRTLSQTDQFMGVASLLLGIPTSGSIDNNTSYYISRPYYGFYAQDDWKVTPRLTLNIGLRYEFQLAYLERYNRMSSMFDITTVNPLSDQILAVWKTNKAAYDATNPKYPYPAPPQALYGVWRFAGKDGFPRRTHYTDWTNAAPRIGFAYRIGQKTVIRGGIGAFYQSDTGTANGQTGFSQTTNYASSFTVNGSPFPSACYNDISGFNNNQCATAPTGPYSLVNPFPKGLTPAAGTSAGLLANIGQGSTSNPLHLKIPRTYQYSLGIQRQLPKDMLLDVSFAGNYALYDRDGQNLGFPQNAAGYGLQQTNIQDPSFFSRNLANPFYNILPTTVSRGSSPTISASSLMDFYSLWSGYTQADVSDRNFRSDGLQVRFEKRMRSNEAGVFTWVTSYTFSKQYSRTCCLGQNWAYDTGAIYVLNPSGTSGSLVTYPYNGKDANLVYAPDSADKYHEIAFSGVWDLPLGRGKRFGNGITGAADKILSGWRADWIFSFISGNLIGLPGGINFCGDYVHYKDPASGNFIKNEDHWYNNNPACYANFPSGALNTQLPPRFSNVMNPAAPQVNVAVAKDTKFGERYKLQFRAESFNVTNTPIRGGPVSGTFTNAAFGQLPKSQNNFPRLVQLALKLYF